MRHKLIVMLLDLEEIEHQPTNTIPGFLERLELLMPSLNEHRCSVGTTGGFFLRVEQGTWMGHVIEHIALELQSIAGMNTGFGRTRSTKDKGIYQVVFSYTEPKAGIYAAQTAVKIAQHLIDATPYALTQDIQNLRNIREKDGFGPSTESIVNEANRRKIPFIRLNKHSMVQFGYGVNQRRIQATMASTTSSIAVTLACNKEETKNLLRSSAIPVPDGRTIYQTDDLKSCIDAIGYPIVLKPVNGNQGKGVTTDIRQWSEAENGFNTARAYSNGVICEEFIAGMDYRVLIVNYKFVAAAQRTPASVKGDGLHTISQLIDIVNNDPRRGSDHEKVLTAIRADQATVHVLTKEGLTLESILPAGKELRLKPTANLSTGGTARDVTDTVHPDNIYLCERVARIIGLDICGIDIIAGDLATPIVQNGGKILEVNAAPGLRMHLSPTEGLPRNIAKPVLDMLYPAGSSAHIPIVAITGTNGKTTTTRLIAHIIQQQGYNVGFTTTDGVYIQNKVIMSGDCTGPLSTQLLLRDPTVDYAVLECARGGILRSGLAFQHCDAAVITNVAEDHLNLEGIDTLKKMARVKSVVAKTVYPGGYAILNADDELVYGMHKELKCKVACFSLNEANEKIRKHCAKGGIAATVDDAYITLIDGASKIQVEKVVNVPVTFSGKAEFNISNALAATLAAYVQGVEIRVIRQALISFIPSPAMTPGRMNMFRFPNYSVLLDYAHNAHGLLALGKFLSKVDATSKVGIIAGVGDRRDEDIVAVGEVSANMFDEIIIRQDKHLRGRTDQNIIDLLVKGIHRVSPDKSITIITKEKDAIDYALNRAIKGSLIVITCDVLPNALEQIINHKLKDEMNYVIGSVF